jgi:Anti-sigma factor N-terminus
MRKGIIMDIKDNLLIMMTPEGEFLKGEKRCEHSYQIGKEIFFFPIQEEKRKQKKFLFSPLWKVASIAAAFLIIITMVSASLLQNKEAYAYVSVDINPSMELSVNHDRKVMEITPFNKDAEKVISELNDWKGEKVEAVTEKIIKECDELGFLTENHTIVIASVFTSLASTKDVKVITNELTSFEQSIEKETNTSITFKEASSKERKEAKEKGMTVAKFMKEKDDTNNSDTNSESQKEKAKDKKDKPSSGRNNHKKEKHLNEQNKQNKHHKDKSRVNNSNQSKDKNKNVRSQHRKIEHPGNHHERKAKKQNNTHKSENNGKGHGKPNHKHEKKDKKEKRLR